MTTPEARARIDIDKQLERAGWTIQDAAAINLFESEGVAVREFPLKPGHGTVDYLLFVEQKAVGVVEAKKVGVTLSGVELQSEKYSTGLPEQLTAPFTPLPFVYQSTGVETQFTNLLDPNARSRRVFNFHRPRTFAEWIGLKPNVALTNDGQVSELKTPYGIPESTRERLNNMPPIDATGMRPAQITAVTNLEESLANGRPRSLIQMATGSGKTYTAVSSTYRLLKYGGVTRVLFLVDRNNLGMQVKGEFEGYTTPDTGRKFTELHIVQHLTSNKIDPAARVVICTIQRLFSILKGDDDIDPELDSLSAFRAAPLDQQPAQVEYSPHLPPEFFGVVFTDEAHRSIYNLWAQVLTYFDSFLIGLTATPSKQTFGFFNQNLVMEYNHSQAVADNVNVDFDVYRIRTQITEQGSDIEAGLMVERRDRETRAQRWEKLDEDVDYAANQLDKDVVSTDQIRTVLKAFKERLFTEIYPGRTEVPKTLIYAKDDSHAEDIVRLVREEFGKGNDFAQKITYKTNTVREVNTVTDDAGNETEEVTYRSSGVTAEDLLRAFRNSYNPRIAVTVDMIATGTDIKPLEIVMFMRTVKSRTYFEQMKGRGVRTINSDDLKQVTSDADGKDRFVIVDAVGVTETELTDSKPLERSPGVSLSKLLQLTAFGSTDPDVASSLASRLARMNTQITDRQREQLTSLSGGKTVSDIAAGIVEALDLDVQIDSARSRNGLNSTQQPTDEQVSKASAKLLSEALKPIASNPGLREELLLVRKSLDQLIDGLSKDVILDATYSKDAKDRAKETVESFEKFIADNRDEITAIQLMYNQTSDSRPSIKEIKELAATINRPPNNWSTESLWKAYEALDESHRVHAGGGRLLGDIVSLVRYAIHNDDELVPYADQVEQRFDHWLEQQSQQGVEFTPHQLKWLGAIRDTIAANMSFEFADFEYAPFAQMGGPGAILNEFGEDVDAIVEELAQELTV